MGENPFILDVYRVYFFFHILTFILVIECQMPVFLYDNHRMRDLSLIGWKTLKEIGKILALGFLY